MAPSHTGQAFHVKWPVLATLGTDTLGIDTLGMDTLGMDTLGTDILGMDILGTLWLTGRLCAADAHLVHSSLPLSGGSALHPALFF